MRWIFGRWTLVASGVIFTVLASTALWGSGAPWRGEWQWTFDNINGSTVLLGPVAAAIAAWTVQDLNGHSDLLRTSTRGHIVPVLQILAVWGWVVLAWIVVAASALAGTLSVVHGGPAPVWVLVAGPIVLAAYVALGGVVGAWLKYRVAALAVAPAVFVLAGVATAAGAPNLLRQGPGTSTLSGLTWSHRTFGLEMVALVALSICTLVVSSMSLGGRSIRERTLVGGAVVVFLGAVTALLVMGDTRFVPSAETATSCVTGEIVVCVAPSNSRALADLNTGFNAVVPRLRAVGLKVPSVFREVLPNTTFRNSSGVIQLGSKANNPNPGPDVVADALATPRDCAAFSDPAVPPPSDMFEARAELMQWFRAGVPVSTPAFTRWAVATYDDLLSCQLGAAHPFSKHLSASAY